MQRFTRLVIALGIGGMVLGFVFFAEEVIPSTAAAVSLCLSSVIPSLLPFFVCSRMLLSLGVCERLGRLIERPFEKVFQLPSVFAGGFFLGCLCGYPMGAKICASFYESGQCTKRQAALGAVLCNNAGPLFIIGTLGTTLLKNAALGRQLWLLHILSSMITALLLRRFLPEISRVPSVVSVTKRKGRLLDRFSEAVADSVQTILQICGLIIFFNAVIKTLLCLGMPASGLLIGGIEMTTGLSFLASENPLHLLPTCSFLLSFGGVCVFMQVAAVFLPQGIPLSPYILGKIIQGSIAAALTVGFYAIFPMPAPTFSAMTGGMAGTESSSVLSLVSLTILALALLLGRKRISRGSP